MEEAEGTHTFQGEEEGKPGWVGGREREQGGVDSPDQGGVLKTEMMTGGQNGDEVTAVF